MTYIWSKNTPPNLPKLAFFFAMFASCVYIACSNSESEGYANYAEITTYNNHFNDTSSSKITDYLPLNDTEYPYAGIPRIVIETENFRKIKDRETEIPAKLQIWGEKAPESEVLQLTIRGRGNTSWGAPQKSYKIEFINKQSMFGMPKDRDWALIANYFDKTLMKNYFMYHLSAELGAYYAPRCEFAELYLNREYLGVYLLTETIKIAKHRINYLKDENSYIVEFDTKPHINEQIIYSSIIKDHSSGTAFKIHAPQNATNDILNKITEHIQNFETYLKTIRTNKQNDAARWIDINEYIKHYWVQEFSKNPDACFQTSIFFSWTTGNTIKMGPVWDFDLAFGSYNNESINSPQNWYIKDSYWNHLIFRDSIMNDSRINYWKTNKIYFENILSIIDSTSTSLRSAAQNNFKKWPILQSTKSIYHNHSYPTYNDATDDLKEWIKQRIEWINSNINQSSNN